MGNKTPKTDSLASVGYEDLEVWVRGRIQVFLQDLLEQEVTELLGRGKSERRDVGIDRSPGYRNGFGKKRKFAMMGGTIEVNRPRVRGLEE